MSALRLVMSHGLESGAAQQILMQIAFSHDLGAPVPVARELASSAGIGTRNAQRALSWLERAGKIRRHAALSQRPRYEVLVKCPPECGQHQPVLGLTVDPYPQNARNSSATI